MRLSRFDKPCPSLSNTDDSGKELFPFRIPLETLARISSRIGPAPAILRCVELTIVAAARNCHRPDVPAGAASIGRALVIRLPDPRPSPAETPRHWCIRKCDCHVLTSHALRCQTPAIAPCDPAP